MPNFQNAVIYKIYCNDTKIKNIYVGSTCNFKRRWNQHKTSCYYEKGPHYNSKLFRFIRDHGGIENWSIEKIMDFPCESDLELRKQETMIIKLLKATLNSSTPYLSKAAKQKYQKDKKLEQTIKSNLKIHGKKYVYNKEASRKYHQKNKIKIKIDKLYIEENRYDWEQSNIEVNDIKEFDRICSLIDNVLKK